MSNSELHDRNTLYNHNLHLPSTTLTLVQKGVLYFGSKIDNYLPLNIKVLSKAAKTSTSKLRGNLIQHKFYSLDEYYQLTFQYTWFLLNIFFILCININLLVIL